MNNLPDFDTLMKMAVEDPAGLEDLRAKSVKAIIDSAPEGRRRSLSALQWKIDVIRQTAKTPLQACVRIQELMHESFGQLRDKLNQSNLILEGVKNDKG